MDVDILYRGYEYDPEDAPSPKWDGRNTEEPCGSVYDSYTYLHLPKAGKTSYFDGYPPGVEEKFNQQDQVLATPLSEAPAGQKQEIESIVKKHSRGVNASSFLGLEVNSRHKTALFASRKDPEDWIGLVSFSGSIEYGPHTIISITHDLTFVNPKHRGILWGPVISGMCGYMISVFLSGKIWESPEALNMKSVELVVTGEPVFDYSKCLIRSFADGANFIVCDGFSFEHYVDELIEAGKIDKAPPKPIYRYGGADLEW